MSSKQVYAHKGLAEKDSLFDFAGALELSAHDFQMNLAAEIIAKEGVKEEGRAISVNRTVGQRVRATMKQSGIVPESLPLEGPISDVKKRLKAHEKLALEAPKTMTDSSNEPEPQS
jgi:DNA-damage-inducible protein D